MKLLNRLQSGRWKSLVQARAKITSNQRLNSCSFEPPGEVDHRLRQLLCQKKLAAALDVMPAAALNRPTAAGEDPGHLIAAQVSSRRSAVAEAMPDKSEAVRVYVEHVEATGQNRSQLGRRRSYFRNTPPPGGLTGSLKMNLSCVFLKNELAISLFENAPFQTDSTWRI